MRLLRFERTSERSRACARPRFYSTFAISRPPTIRFPQTSAAVIRWTHVTTVALAQPLYAARKWSPSPSSADRLFQLRRSRSSLVPSHQTRSRTLYQHGVSSRAPLTPSLLTLSHSIASSRLTSSCESSNPPTPLPPPALPLDSLPLVREEMRESLSCSALSDSSSAVRRVR